MSSRHDWSGQQLAEFLAVVGSYLDEQSALDGAVEFAAIAVEAEFGAVVRGDEVTSCIGFRRGREPADLLRLAAAERPTSIVLPDVGPCSAMVAPVGEQPDTTMLIIRSGDGFTPEERTLLAGMARVIKLAIRPLRALEVERALRRQSQRAADENQRLLAEVRERQVFLERISDIERAISERQPMQTIFDLIAAGAAEVLSQEVAVLRLLDEDDPEYVLIVASVGRDPVAQAPLARSKVDTSLGGRVIVTEQLLVADDYPRSDCRVPAVVEDGIASAMAAPVHRDGIVAGSLLVASRSRCSYSASQQDVLRSFAGHVSLALNDASAQESMRRAYGEAVHRANHDPLTGLPNRAVVTERLGRALRRRRAGRVVVLFVDLDRFKGVNDSYGHAMGDQVLVTVAERLQATVRPGDTVARLAGDEFLVVCEDMDTAAAARLADRIAGAIAEPMVLDGREVVITASAGVTAADDGRTADEVLRDADVAMYRAKQRGRARVELFDKAMRTEILQRLDTEQALRRALRDGHLRVFYQPIVRTSSGKPVGVEALVRWDRPGVGLVPPGHFIPIAEEAGLIVPIGAWVLEEACAQVERWRSADPRLGDLRLNVNLSARQFNDPSVVSLVQRSLARAGLPGRALALEITESVLMDDAEATGSTLSALRELGVRLSIDDFGTGYSSLSYLKRFPVSELKVDRSFVDGLGRDAEDDAIVRAVIGLAHALGLDVTGEGVETIEQYEQLHQLGCTAVQGYLLGHPMPAAEVPDALSSVVARLRRSRLGLVPAVS